MSPTDDRDYFSQICLCLITWDPNSFSLPATHDARMLAMFQAVVGVFYVASVVAVFVGTYSTQSRESSKRTG